MKSNKVMVPDKVVFEWDEGNLSKNRLKHGVVWEECEEIFYNEPLLVSEDIKHSEKEKRYQVLGQTSLGRGLMLVFTFREERVRVVSARDQNRRERKNYQEIIKQKEE